MTFIVLSRFYHNGVICVKIAFLHFKGDFSKVIQPSKTNAT